VKVTLFGLAGGRPGGQKMRRAGGVETGWPDGMGRIWSWPGGRAIAGLFEEMGAYGVEPVAPRGGRRRRGCPAGRGRRSGRAPRRRRTARLRVTIGPGAGASRTAGVGEQHQREQPGGFGVPGQQAV
jgi:hypothetical protein